jgi:hypothetical protein
MVVGSSVGPESLLIFVVPGTEESQTPGRAVGLDLIDVAPYQTKPLVS